MNFVVDFSFVSAATTKQCLFMWMKIAIEKKWTTRRRKRETNTELFLWLTIFLTNFSDVFNLIWGRFFGGYVLRIIYTTGISFAHNLLKDRSSWSPFILSYHLVVNYILVRINTTNYRLTHHYLYYNSTSQAF